MTMRTFELFVAGRYLRAKRKQAVISVITVISIAGVAAGVMALVIGIAINNGFRDTLQRSLLGATAHVMVLAKDSGQGIDNWRELDPKFRRLPHVISVAPNLYGPVLLAGAEMIRLMRNPTLSIVEKNNLWHFVPAGTGPLKLPPRTSPHSP